MQNKKKLVVAIMLMFITVNLSAQFAISNGTRKVATTIALIEQMYVDSVDDNKLAEDAIISLLQKLDPHSSYLSKEEVIEMNEPLEGNFDGIGISFNMMTDSLYVIETIADGPSQRVGILPGDRIIKVNDSIISGVKMSTKEIMKRLRGKKGTQVKVSVSRRGVDDLIEFLITRDRIPIYSLDASYMVNDSIGYIRLSRFGATTVPEFREALAKLQKEGLQKLILDLQSNGGGYLGAASELSNELLGKNKLIVYMEGENQKKMTDVSSKEGMFEQEDLVILVDEASASASEIVSGAIQDWDRGVIVGRRTFGKGLVQRQFPLPDGSMIRLTTARYYTPTGRSIQKPYIKGDQETYNHDLIDRYNRGEMMNVDSIHFPDSLKYKTLVNNRIVYGGGGIMPDYFVPIDTTAYSDYSGRLFAMGTIYKVSMREVDLNRKELLQTYPTVEEYITNFEVSEKLLQDLIDAATNDKIEFKEVEYNKSKNLIKKRLKALMARDLYETSAFYKVVNQESDIFNKALQILQNGGEYNKLLNLPRTIDK